MKLFRLRKPKHEIVSAGLALLLMLGTCVPATGEAKAGQKEKRKGEPSVLYFEVKDQAKEIVQAMKKIYGGTFRLVGVSRKDGFAPSRLKGELPYLYDPRDKSERSSPGRAVFVYIVSARGIVSDVRLLESNIPEAAANSLNAIQARWSVPARLRGQPVASVVIDQLPLEPPQKPSWNSDGFGGRRN